MSKRPRRRYAIFTPTLCQGLVPAWHDKHGDPVVYESLLAAQREIADDQIIKLTQFLGGERSFDDAVEIEDVILPVTVLPDKSIALADGSIFGRIS